MNISSSPSQATQSLAYDPTFFAQCAPGARYSAQRVLGLLANIYTFKTVLDVGCGQGAWLAAAEELGATRLVGLDGPWVKPNELHSGNIDFKPTNLESHFTLGEVFDLCVSVEVAEHLAPSVARRFVDNLCASSDVIVFSGAIPDQGGVLHINERWQSYWAELFQRNGFLCHDPFRPVLWNDATVESWYRQNTLLYVKRSHPLSTLLASQPHPRMPLDVVHPAIYSGNVETYTRSLKSPTVKVCGEMMWRCAKRQLAKLTSSSASSA